MGVPAPGAKSATSVVQKQLEIYVSELERLPSALRAWAEAAMDDEDVDDPVTRKAVLIPLAEVQETVLHGVSVAKLVAKASAV